MTVIILVGQPRAGHAYDGNGNELLVNGVQASYDFENHLVQLGTRDYTAYTYDADGNGNTRNTRWSDHLAVELSP